MFYMQCRGRFETCPYNKNISMTEKNNQIDKNNKHTEPVKMPAPHKPMNTWKHMVAHVCIWFLVIILVMVYFYLNRFTTSRSFRGGSICVNLCRLVSPRYEILPLVSKIITSVIVIGFGIALIFVNYHYLKVVKKMPP